tara:strand:- start:401 stop:673 length:273 start_codon:yes stop_codon:yes gene_type:complete
MFLKIAYNGLVYDAAGNERLIRRANETASAVCGYPATGGSENQQGRGAAFIFIRFSFVLINVGILIEAKSNSCIIYVVVTSAFAINLKYL